MNKDVKRKINKLISMANENDVKYLRFIQKNFGDIDYKHEGSNLLHLVLFYYSDTYFLKSLDASIIKLIKLGVDPNSKDAEGNSFLHKYLDKGGVIQLSSMLSRNILDYKIEYNVSVVDNEGNTILHRVIKNCKGELDFYSCYELFRLFCDVEEYNFDFSIRNNIGESVLDCLIKKNNKEEINEMVLNPMVETYYKYNIDELLNLILDTDEQDLFKKLKATCLKPYSALLICQVYQPENDEVINKSLQCVKKLISIGCLAEKQLGDSNFIYDAIDKKYPISYIKQIVDMAEQYESDKVWYESLVFLATRNESIWDVINMYVISSRYGYSYKDFMKDIELFINNPARFHTFKEGIRRSEICNYIRLEGLKIMLNDALERRNFNNILILNNNIAQHILEIIEQINTLLEFDNDYQFVESFCNFIVEKYNTSIMYVKTISEKEVLVNLREYLDDLLDNKLNKLFVLKNITENNE